MTACPKAIGVLAGLVDPRLTGAACAGRAPLFDDQLDGEYDDDREYRLGAAARICRGCPVLALCGTAANEHPARGVWGWGATKRGRSDRPPTEGSFMTTNHTPTDALAYLLLLVKQRVEWATDQIGGNIAMDGDTAEQLYSRNEFVLDSLDDLIRDAEHIALPHLDAATYSDGRPIRSSIELGGSTTFQHLWHPDPAQESERTVPVRMHNADAVVTIAPPSTLSAAVVRRLTAVEDDD